MYAGLLESMNAFEQPKSLANNGKKRQKKTGMSDAKSLLKQMQNASKFAQMKFKDLLDVSLLDTGTFTLRESRFTVTDIIREVCELMEAQANAQNVKIAVDLDQITFREAIGDANRI